MDSIWFPDDKHLRESVQSLHESIVRASVICSGGAFGLSQLLWSVPGMGNEIFEIIHPVEWRPHLHLAGVIPPEACSERAAIHYATAAHSRMQAFANHFPPRWEIDDIREGCVIAGIAITASLTTDRARRPVAHQICAAMCRDEGTVVVNLAFRPARTNRAEQGKIADLVGLNLLLEAATLPLVPLDAEAFSSGDYIARPDDASRVILCPRRIT